jgi:Domain of unknown function (DUF5658)
MDVRTTEQTRDTIDRRRKPTSFWDTFGLGGRRMRCRRADEHRQPYFVDRFGREATVWGTSLLVLSISDGVITLFLLDAGCQEINPFMAYLLQKGCGIFLLAKYLLTATAVITFLVFKNFYLFGTPFRVGYLIPVLVSMYAALILYQFYLVYYLASG